MSIYYRHKWLKKPWNIQYYGLLLGSKEEQITDRHNYLDGSPGYYAG